MAHHPFFPQQPRSLLTRLRQALIIARCTGGPIFIERPAAAHALQPARGQCVDAPDAEPSIGWRLCDKTKHCGRCPRFEAYRQGLAADKTWDWNLSVSVGAQKVKADVRDGDREGAQVDQVDHENRDAITTVARRNLNPNPDSVADPVAPCVEDPEARAQHSDNQGDVVKNGFEFGVHSATVAQQGGAA